jgi:hypothetical protein
MTSQRADVERTVERLVEEVAGWEGITVAEHRFGGTEFRVGPRETGHVHAWGMLDIAYLRKLRDVLVDAGHTGVHHLLTESGWTTYHIESADDYDHARWLLRLSYLYHVNIAKKTPAGAEELAGVDVGTEVDRLGLSEPVRAAFERWTPA